MESADFRLRPGLYLRTTLGYQDAPSDSSRLGRRNPLLSPPQGIIPPRTFFSRGRSRFTPHTNLKSNTPLGVFRLLQRGRTGAAPPELSKHSPVLTYLHGHLCLKHLKRHSVMLGKHWNPLSVGTRSLRPRSRWRSLSCSRHFHASSSRLGRGTWASSGYGRPTAFDTCSGRETHALFRRPTTFLATSQAYIWQL